MEFLDIKPGLRLPLHEITFSATTAGGPGGQHVNRSLTAIQLRFDICNSSLPAEVKSRLLTLAGGQVSSSGVLLIRARSHRSQEQNRREALERLRQLLIRAASVPKARRPTRPSKSARKKRVDQKIRRGRTKALRGRVREG
ncbi:aminoacyl-tRNA hydrolase [Geothermobacter hydrogeniphilus]|uniref:Aminoacyl-tRNA hydrolase n=1 Tax=Geothermobacter hydrogeniphilus TaxID=1969733 RepID=A0A2K2H666_9BACT|nr:alternative ribosome rescue aminoacyl-tRNA hydrolase ArfB [Geothermobacter hydrogeniphilus]PNU18815.1 aminoacyl-tRNA hydrolase [Geothermobacter hydrogeniphilus]